MVGCKPFTLQQILPPFSLQDDRRAADERLKKEQDKVDRALQAARNAGDKDRQVKDLVAQVDALTVSLTCLTHYGGTYLP